MCAYICLRKRFGPSKRHTCAPDVENVRQIVGLNIEIHTYIRIIKCVLVRMYIPTPPNHQGHLYEVIQWFVTIVPDVVGRYLMAGLVGSGIVFPNHDRVDRYDGVFNIPFYQVCVCVCACVRACVCVHL